MRIFQILIYLIISHSVLFAQEETFSLVSSSGDTLLAVKANGTLLFNGKIYHNGTPIGVPVGTIQAWDKNLNGTPELKDGWVECNGQSIDDSDSPYYGQNVPNLNGSGENSRILKGANISGTFGGSTTHNHMWGSNDTRFGNGVKFMIKEGNHYDSRYTRSFDSEGNISSLSNYYDMLVGAYYTSKEETLPPYYEIVWIIKVK